MRTCKGIRRAGGPDCLSVGPPAPISRSLRPAVVLCPGGGYGFVSPREDQPVAMEFLAAGCQVFSLHYSVAPETFPVALMELAKAVALVKTMPVNGILIQSGLWYAVSPREATWPPAWA